MWIRNVAPYLALCALSPLALGCSSSSNLDSGVDDGKQVGSISTTEAEQLCNAQADYVESVRTEALFCESAGYNAAYFASFDATATDAALQAACEESQTTCAKAYQDSLEQNELFSCEGARAPLADCTATVGIYETCFSDTLGAQVDRINGYPACSGYTRAYVEAQGQPDPYADTEACDELQTKCVIAE